MKNIAVHIFISYEKLGNPPDHLQDLALLSAPPGTISVKSWWKGIICKRKRKATCANKNRHYVKRKEKRYQDLVPFLFFEVQQKRREQFAKKKGTLCKKEQYHMQIKVGKIPCVKNRRKTLWEEIGNVPCANKQSICVQRRTTTETMKGNRELF